MSKDAQSDPKLRQKERLREEANIALKNLRKPSRKAGRVMTDLDWNAIKGNVMKRFASDRRPFVGIPVVELGRHDLLESIFTEVGWEATANLRALLEPYFRTKSIEGIHYRDL